MAVLCEKYKCTENYVSIVRKKMRDTPPGQPQKRNPGDAVRAIREKAGLTQAEFARIIGASRPTVSGWERGVRPIPPKKMKAINEKFGFFS